MYCSKLGFTEFFHSFDYSADDLPTVQVVCDNFGLNDVELDYTEADYQNLTTCKLFQQAYLSRIQGANPKSPKPRLMMLLAAKWREFQTKNPNTPPRLVDVMEIDQENLEEETERQLTPPPKKRGRPSKAEMERRAKEKAEKETQRYINIE